MDIICLGKDWRIPKGSWLTIFTLPKFQTLPEVTCVNGIHGKCVGTITPQHFTGCM